MWLFNKRITRLTSCFSKAFRQHKAAMSLQIAHYNLCRKHRTLKTTPAIAAGVTDRVWTVADLVTAWDLDCFLLARYAPVLALRKTIGDIQGRSY